MSNVPTNEQSHAWAHLPNAALIAMLINKTALAQRTPELVELHRHLSFTDLGTVSGAGDREDAVDAAWEDAWLAAAAVSGVVAAASSFCASALALYDDMPAYIAMSRAELEALYAMSAGTTLGLKLVAAQIYQAIVVGS